MTRPLIQENLYSIIEGYEKRIDRLERELILREGGTTIAASTKGFVNHGANQNTARPSGYTSVEWYGSVEPLNALDGDTWVNTS